jgi:hypothetical protein
MKYTVFLYIFLASLAYAHAQSAGREPRESNKLNQHQELGSQRLSEAQVLAYTKRAKQKLQDMADYVQIIANSKDATEQKQALKQLHHLFWTVPAWAKTAQSVGEYAGKTKKMQLAYTNITQPLVFQANLQAYKGSLAYAWANKSDSLDFIVRKNKKKVGSTEVEVWELFFNP